MGSMSSLAPVRYVLRCSGEHVPELLVRRVELREALSEPHELVVEAATADEAGIDALLGASCTLTLGREEAGRKVHGVVTRVERLEAVAARERVRLTIRPALALLEQRVCTRFWQGLRAPEIALDVLREPLRAFGREVRLELEVREYPVREYCVQYRESDLEFVRRLLQEEGIAFSFDHSGEREVLVLHDTTTRARDLEIAAVPVVARGAGAAAEQSIDSLAAVRELGSAGVVRRDWDFRDPEGRPRTHERRAAGATGGGGVRARGGRGPWRRRGASGAAGARGIELALRAGPREQRRRRAGAGSLSGGGGAPGGGAADPGDRGGAFGGGARGAAPRRRRRRGGALRQSIHVHPARGALSGAGAGADAGVYGPHTAIVVGPPGEEIHTDEYGRIKVRFHWDRDSPPDDSASCWIRVAQAWAGAGWGAQHVPRVGMEVVVEFLDGDPDLPLVTGCVYNAGNLPPHALPEHKTRSGLRSDTTPGGGGHNEIYFEDAKGREQLRVHAQRDMQEVIRNRHAQTVYGDQEVEVRGAQAVTVRRERRVEVGEGDDALTVTGGSRTTKVHGSDELRVETGDCRCTVEQGTFVLTAETAVELTARQAWLSLQATRTATLESTGAGVGVKGKETVAVVSTCGGLNLQGDAAVTLRSLRDRACVTAPRELSLESEASVRVCGGERVEVATPTMTIRAESEISLVVGGSSITLRPDGITLQGPKITSTALGVHEIAGGLVKIN